MRKLGASLIGWRKEAVEEQINAIADAGFDCFFTGYYREEPIEQWAELGARRGLNYEMIHCHYREVNTFWVDAPEGDDYLTFLKTRVDGCACVNVPLLVMHATRFTDPPPISDVGLNRFRRLNDYAREKNVHMTYENVENPEYLAAVMSVTDDYHGFCWDCGHNYCYSPDVDMLALYGKRLMNTHVHDNFGVSVPGVIHNRDDLHLLPFDGGLPWKDYAQRLKKTGFTGPISLEMSCEARESDLMTPLPEYLEKARERAARFRELIDG